MVNGKRPWRKDLFQRYMGVVNSEVVGEETQLEVGEGILPSQEGNLERAMGFEPTTSCLGSKPQAQLFVNTRKATKGLTPSGEKWLIEALLTFSKVIQNPVDEVIKEHVINFYSSYRVVTRR
jgi:hypothetical protein